MAKDKPKNVYNIRDSNFGITDVGSRSYWLVRLTAQHDCGRTFTVNRQFAYLNHVEKQHALVRARRARDKMLEWPEVRRFRSQRSQGNKVWRVQYQAEHKRALSQLVGIRLMPQVKASGNTSWFIRATFGSSPTEKYPQRRMETATFSLKVHGIRGALDKAVAFRRSKSGSALYTDEQIDQALVEMIKTHGADFREAGIDMSTVAKF